MKNAATKKNGAKKAMACSEFMLGWNDAKQCKPMRDDWEGRDRLHIGSQQWTYERGRMFYHYAKSVGADNIPVKIGRQVNQAMCDLFMEAYRAKYIL